MRVLIACDSFKDALDAPRVCAAIASGLRRRSTDIVATEFPLGDGGEGTGEILRRHLKLDAMVVETLDPLLRVITAKFAIAQDKSIAVVELADASGLQRLVPQERNPLHTTTLGAGSLIAAAIAAGAKRVVLCVGGSATHDCGIGIAAALGWRFIDAHGSDVVPVGSNLLGIRNILPPAQRMNTPVDVLCDVNNPLTGKSGAAHVYAHQKGARAQDIELLERGTKHLLEVIRDQGLCDASPDSPGAGAAGGVGYGAMAFLNATLHRGIDYVLDATHFDAALAAVDCVITGEGRLDAQTLHGKAIRGVCERAARANKPVIALCGQLIAAPGQLRDIGLHSTYCINDGLSTENALAKTAERLTATAARIELPAV